MINSLSSSKLLNSEAPSTQPASSSADSKIKQFAQRVLDALGVIFGGIRDVLTLPFAIGVVAIEVIARFLNKDFNPKPEDAKIGKTAIVLLHGSSFCQAQWHLARAFLKGEEFGSVYSLNYAEGLISNEPESGIGDYASGEKLRNLIAKIKEDTKQNRVIIVGHSMGSLVGECFAQRHSEEMGVEVPHLVSMSSPWHGAPAVDLLGLKARRLQEMSVSSGAPEHIAFRKNLVEKAIKADKAGKRLQWNLWSKHDLAVPGKSGRLTEEPSRQYEAWGEGHFSPMLSYKMLSQLRTWMKEIYKTEPKAAPLPA